MPDKIVPINRGETRVRYTDPENDGVYAEVVSNSVGVFDVTDPAYGAVGDGVADDQPAIQAAVDAAGAAGGGTVFFPAGRYNLVAHNGSPSDTPYGDPPWLRAHIEVPYDNMSLIGQMGATLVATGAYPIIRQGKTGTPTGGGFLQAATVRTMNGPVVKGATSITLSTAGNSAYFAAGDHVVIRTGQLVDGNIYEPDAEINRVVTSAAGVLTLAWPTTKTYAQEYFISGTTGFTSTGVTANPAQFGVANVEDMIVRDHLYQGLRFEHTGTNAESYVFLGGSAIRTTIDRCTASVAFGFEIRSKHRFTTISGCNIDFTGASQGVAFSTDTMCSDAIWQGNIVTGVVPPYFHIHEGTMGVIMRDNIVRSKASGSSLLVVGVRTRSGDVIVSGNIFDTDSTGSIVYLSSDSRGGTISDNHFLGSVAEAISVYGPGVWKLTGNRTPYGANIGTPDKVGSIDSDVRVMSCWVTTAQPTSSLGMLGAGCIILDMKIHVAQAFNPAGTGTISVGKTSGHADLGAVTDVKSEGIKTISPSYAQAWINGNNADWPLVAYYEQTSTAATQGSALVVVTYIASGIQW